MQRVGVLLQKLDGKDTLPRRLAEAGALERWPEIVGTELAKRTRPARIAGDTLYVIAHGASLRQELSFHRRTILRKFNNEVGTRAVSSIVFLESDNKLSSLVEPPESVVAARAEALRRVEERSEVVETEECTEHEEPERQVDRAPMYLHFRADEYRRELMRIEHESRSER